MPVDQTNVTLTEYLLPYTGLPTSAQDRTGLPLAELRYTAGLTGVSLPAPSAGNIRAWFTSFTLPPNYTWKLADAQVTIKSPNVSSPWWGRGIRMWCADGSENQNLHWHYPLNQVQPPTSSAFQAVPWYNGSSTVYDNRYFLDRERAPAILLKGGASAAVRIDQEASNADSPASTLYLELRWLQYSLEQWHNVATAFLRP